MRNFIRVLQVVSLMNRGGAETMIMNIYRKMDKSKVQFDFIVHSDKKGEYDDEIKQLGGNIYHIPKYNGINHFRYKKAWNNFFKEHTEYKIIHSHVRSTAIIYLSIAKKFGLTTIIHSHSTSSGHGLKGFIKNLFQYPLRYKVDYLAACSDLAGKWLYGAKALKKINYLLIKNSIDAKAFIFNKEIREEKRKELNLKGKLVIGHIGRFTYVKNHKFLINIFKEISLQNQNAILLLIGSGELLNDVKNQVTELNLEDKVVFLGSRNDVPQLLQAIDLLIFPSFYEGLPLTVIEAQAAGVPCLISDTITDEVILTDLIEKLSINIDAEIWADKTIELFSQHKRINRFHEIYEKDYDIHSLVKSLTEFYLTNSV